jgi:hypothetical protein
MDSMNDYLPFSRLLSDPIRAGSKAGLLALLGLILGLILPGLLYLELGTFSQDAVINHLRASDNPGLKNVIARVERFNVETDLLKNNIALLESRLAGNKLALAPNETTLLLNTRRDLRAYLDSRTPPFHVEGFYPDPTMFLWSIFYVSFFWLLFIFAPLVKRVQSLTSQAL